MEGLSAICGILIEGFVYLLQNLFLSYFFFYVSYLTPPLSRDYITPLFQEEELKEAYWISSNSSFIQYCDNFLYCSPFSYRSSNFAIVGALNPFASNLYTFCRLVMASFLYCFPYSYRSSNYCDINSCRSFTLLKAIAKSKSKTSAFKSEKEQ